MNNDKSDYKLIIFDVDGTLVTTKSGATFRKSADDWQWLPGRLEKLQELNRQRVILAIATNQGGVAFGYMAASDIHQELRRMADEADIPAIAFDITHPKASIEELRKDSPRRKPAPGMLLELIEASRAAKQETLMVGDRPEDEQAAKNAGVAFMWADDFFTQESR